MSRLKKIYAWLDSLHSFFYLVTMAFMASLGAFLFSFENSYIKALGVIYCLALVAFSWGYAIFRRTGRTGK